MLLTFSFLSLSFFFYFQYLFVHLLLLQVFISQVLQFLRLFSYLIQFSFVSGMKSVLVLSKPGEDWILEFVNAKVQGLKSIVNLLAVRHIKLKLRNRFGLQEGRSLCSCLLSCRFDNVGGWILVGTLSVCDESRLSMRHLTHDVCSNAPEVLNSGALKLIVLVGGGSSIRAVLPSPSLCHSWPNAALLYFHHKN